MNLSAARGWLGGTSLVRRLTIALTLVVGVTTLVVALSLSAALHRAEESEVRRNVVSSATVLAHLLEPAVWDLDMDRAVALGEAFAQDPRVVRIAIHEGSATTREIVRSSASDTITSTAPILHDGERLGSVDLVFSRELYRERAAHGTRQAVALGLVVLIAALSTLHLLLGRLLHRPLDALTATVSRYATSDYDSPRPSVPYAEFAPFWEVLERMAARIRAQLRDLHDANAMLASEVQERTRAERRAERSRQMLALVIDAVPQSVFWKDTNSVYLGANAVFARWVGLPSAEAVIGLTDDEMAHADSDPTSRRALDREVMETGERCEIVQEFACADGVTRWLETTKIPLVGDRGEVIGLLGVSVDVTERRAAAERAERLRHAQKLEAIGTLAGGVAHDFNNVVTAIQLQLELLVLEHPLTGSVRSVVRDVRTSVDRAAHVARQLLAFGRRQPMTVARVELDEVLCEQLRMLTRVIGRQVTVRYEPAVTPLPVDVDACMIEQVLTNLCLNARDAMPGGGTITVRTARVDVDEAMAWRQPDARAGAFACVEVADTGHGMTEQTRQRIFEPFFTTKKIGEGTGLGLATSHGIVVQHGGFIDVASRVGEGTTFRVYVPLAADDRPDDAADAVAGSPPEDAAQHVSGQVATPRQPGILVIGGDDPAPRTAVRALRRLGYDVYAARDVAEALRLLDARADVALALVDAPALEAARGDAASQRLHAMPHLDVVILSDFAPSERQIAARERVLLKPFSLAGLRRVVDESIRGRRAPRAPR